ncbi:hypothetical protein PPYR_03814 [Photinus pyralis]|uniref:Cytochrome c oxidase assembly protein COX15 n=1 Tax=Photinus pyralis TaxID=7054 RepID=A0A5N4AWL5_PHOPY|nr:cytochrome c oxidase assembly protein COX15 homolog [Photinus pyralis]KAB0801628.1 hypothetical protein PPYR_03814 [Photinus pyralis]
MFCVAKLCKTTAIRFASVSTTSLLKKPQNLIPRELRRGAFNNCTARSTVLKKFLHSRLCSEAGVISTRLKSNAVARYKKAIGYWLLTSSGMVFVAVILGGVTRLTESGLSMVTWKLLGERMPRTEEEWIAEFSKYKQFPEFLLQRPDMTLTEFKFIYFMEYAHRMWGRAIGAVFLLPAVFFWTRGAFTPQMKIRISAFGGLILAQGLFGWYMVKSGLEKKDDDNTVVRVSQYRLATHLSLAFVLYSLFLWSSLDHLLPAETISNISNNAIKNARKFRMFAHSCKGMVFFTAVSGALLAGIDGGLVYNSFPKMADKWIPDDILAYKPTLKNFTENPTTVQFDHRILGITTLTLISTLWILSKRRTLPPRAYIATNALATMAWLQVILGISTLLMYVPVPLAASHQSGSLVLLSLAVWLTHELKRLPKI